MMVSATPGASLKFQKKRTRASTIVMHY